MTNSKTHQDVIGPFALLRPHRYILPRLASRLEYGRLTLVLPDRTTQTFEGKDPSSLRAVIDIRRLRAVRRLLTEGANGLAEAYMDGDWSSPDLSACLALAGANEIALGAMVQGLAPAILTDRVRHLLRANSRGGSRKNIAYHYDLGNAFFERWLDPSMTYSSALYEHAAQTLEQAQAHKNRRLAESLRLEPGQRLLEIGCGWGGFAILAARDYGCRVTAITLSREQMAHARRRVQEAGLEDRIEVVLRDYRDVEGRFDRIASIEMFEAVGEEYWPAFFDVLRERLMPEGLAGLQIITIADDRFETYRTGVDFIQRYIFPGGMLPSPTALGREVERAGLRITESETFGASYARTLAEWQQRFQHAWPEIASLGFDVRFKRMWEFYLAYCEAGFHIGPLDVGQYVVARR